MHLSEVIYGGELTFKLIVKEVTARYGINFLFIIAIEV